jgi:hypothetical protein
MKPTGLRHSRCLTQPIEASPDVAAAPWRTASIEALQASIVSWNWSRTKIEFFTIQRFDRNNNRRSKNNVTIVLPIWRSVAIQ